MEAADAVDRGGDVVLARERGKARTIAARILVAVGFVVHCMVGYLYALTAMAFQGLALLVLWGIWIALLVLAIRRVGRPWYVLATPLLAVIIWVLYVSAHDALTG